MILAADGISHRHHHLLASHSDHDARRGNRILDFLRIGGNFRRRIVGDHIAFREHVERQIAAVIVADGLAFAVDVDYAELIKVNPSLVMVSMAAFGATGPWRETRAYGSTLEQGSGLPSVGGRAHDPPMMNHLAYGDAVGGLNACSAMLVALLHRRETGEGQFIDLSQVQCMLPFTAAWAIEQSANGRVAPRTGNRHPSFVPHGVFPSAGADKWVSIAVTDDAMWSALARLIGIADPALATAAGRRAQEDRIESAISELRAHRNEREDALREAVRDEVQREFSALELATRDDLAALGQSIRDHVTALEGSASQHRSSSTTDDEGHADAAPGPVIPTQPDAMITTPTTP